MALRKQKVEHFTKLTVIQQESDDKLRRAAKVLAKNAVSQRPDQILKPGWITHCTTLKHGGAVINNLDDLLSAPGYDAEITSIAVSYTHLDVYKRQAFDLWKARQAGLPTVQRALLQSNTVA